MRHTVLLQDGWRFAKTAEIPAAFPESWQPVTLPHTWNAADGTDGGNDYWRGTACYCRCLTPPALAAGEQLWLEFEGAAMTAEVYLNGQKLARHEDGYSTFRVELTPALVEGVNLLAVLVDNSENDTVYPQKADFTFYGGLYRPVRLITVPAAHFALDCYGGPGLKVTPAVDLEARTAAVTVEAWITGEAASVTFSTAGQTFTVPVENGHASAVFTLENVHLWDGIEDPYLYTVTASLDSGDSISVRYGCRTIGFDADKGFLLNGRVYRLCGAARHQDRQGLGSALTDAEHEEDLALLREIGRQHRAPGPLPARPALLRPVRRVRPDRLGGNSVYHQTHGKRSGQHGQPDDRAGRAELQPPRYRLLGAVQRDHSRRRRDPRHGREPQTAQ